MKPNWVINDFKYQRALAGAKHRDNEDEVKALYVSYGGKLALEDFPSGIVGNIITETTSETTGTEIIAEKKSPAKRGRKAKVLAEDGAETLPEVG